jgi:hypothetical protein
MAPPCPTQDFSVRFSNGSAVLLDEAALDALAEDLDRARPCDVLVAIILSYDTRKGEAVRDAMAAQGLPAAYAHVVRLDAVHEPPVSGADHSQARVIIVFH